MMKNYRLLFISLLLMGLSSTQVQANNLILQRWQFEHALEALTQKNLEKFQQLSTGLQDYPLYYYLRYQYLKPRLSQEPSFKIQAFLKHYGHSYFGNSLRRNWLKQLAKQGDWTNFIQAYTPQKNIVLQCYYAQARFLTRQQYQEAIHDAQELWLVGKSRPNACDPAFEYLYQNGLINDAMLRERINLAMQKGRLKLARALAKRLDSETQASVARWQKMHQKPTRTLAEFEDPDSPMARTIILHGIKRLAKTKFELAQESWQAFQSRYAFSAQQIGEMQRDLALASVKHNHPEALKWLTAVNNGYLNEEVSKTRLKLALRQQNWHAMTDFITELPETERNTYKSRYWLARSLEQTGQAVQAQMMYQKLAKERDYYGFLAADRIKAEHQMQHKPIVFSPADKTRLMKQLSIRAAYELYQLNQVTNDNAWLIKARREWHYAISHLPTSQKAVAAALASRWKWYDRAIMAAAQAGYYDDIEVRFPLAYYEPLAMAARNQGVDLAWAYGITRQESAFMSDVRSRAGALGLMQLMPATGRLVARKIGLSLPKTRDILDIETNVNLGTAYLKQMLDRFDGNYMLATAAYNAGPGRSKRWAKQNSCMPADIWVEMIPFNETRKYVRRVLFYTSIFESRLGQQSRPLRIGLAPKPDCPTNYTQHSHQLNNIISSTTINRSF